MVLFDVAPIAGGIGIFAAVAFFFVFAALAFIAFKMLRRSVKMAFRMAIVAVILTIAVAGSIALWAFNSRPAERPRPTRTK